jgi:uncharacterized protein YrrD
MVSTGRPVARRTWAGKVPGAELEMRWKELKDRPVVSVAGAERLGFVDDLFLDSAGRMVLGLGVRRGGLLTHREAMMLRDVQAVGGDAVTVLDASKLNKEASFSELESRSQASRIIGSRILTEDGQEIGTVSDLVMDLEQSEVTEYRVGGSLLDRFRGEERFIPITAVKSLGDGLIVVDNAMNQS